MRYTILLLIGILLLVGETAAQADRPRIGLALGGGGAKGLAHIGLLKAFEEEGIPVDYIAGASAGALIGGCYAAGISLDEMERLVESGNIGDIFMNVSDPASTPIEYRYDNLPSQVNLLIRENRIVNPLALLNDAQVNEYLFITTAAGNAYCGGDFSRLCLPFACVTANVMTRQKEVLTQGTLWTAVRASLAYPLAYAPVFSDSSVYMDGGIYDNLPIDALKEMGADIIVAVNVSDIPPKSGQLEDIEDIFALLSNVLAPPTDSLNVKGWDYFIQVDTRNIGLIDFSSGAQLIEAGYSSGKKAAARIRREYKFMADTAAFHAKQKACRTYLDGKKIARIGLDGNFRYPHTYIRNLMETQAESPYSPTVFQNDLKRLDASGFFSRITTDFAFDPADSSLDITLHLTEAPPRKIQAGLYYDNSGGLNLYAEQSLTDLFKGRFHISNRIFFGNWHQGINPVLHLFNIYNLPLLNLRVSSRVSMSYDKYNSESRISGHDRISSEIWDLSWSGLAAIGWNSLTDMSFHLKKAALLDPHEGGLISIPGLRNNSPYIQGSVNILTSTIRRDMPIEEGLQSNIAVRFGKILNTQSLPATLEPLQETFLIGQARLYRGIRPLRSFAVYGEADIRRSRGILPFGEYDAPPAGESNRFTADSYLLTQNYLSLSLGIANRFLWNELWFHASPFYRWYQFHNTDKYADINGVAQAGIDLFLRYQSLLGPISYGMTLIDASQGTNVRTWARIGFIF